ncbi:MAG TPA: SGNH/GDSL hydrolase family protein, partial [Bryobacteraceae bacterium]|nr:SGNH/GDSL hydrolase family protein [Bryobacteraceae bacterium]
KQLLLAIGLNLAVCSAQSQTDRIHNDWAYLAKYREANAALAPPAPAGTRVVFMGDSITENWARMDEKFFETNSYIGRGISGQTTPQMLVRFRADVIDLQPRVVLILAGTNDIAGNTGPSTLEMIEANLMSMSELARANNIRIILASVLPVYDYAWKPGLQPAPKISALNNWIKEYAGSTGATYLDFYTPMADERGGMKAELSGDGVHPNSAGYAIMDPLAVKAIAEALRK